jgi:hypothetical protein
LRERRIGGHLDSGPYGAPDQKIQVAASRKPAQERRITRIRSAACAALALPASPPRRTLDEPVSPGTKM